MDKVKLIGRSHGWNGSKHEYYVSHERSPTVLFEFITHRYGRGHHGVQTHGLFHTLPMIIDDGDCQTREKYHEDHARLYLEREKEMTFAKLSTTIRIPPELINIISDYITASKPVPFPEPADDAHKCIAHILDLTTMYNVNLTQDTLQAVINGQDCDEVWRITDRQDIMCEFTNGWWTIQNVFDGSHEYPSIIMRVLLQTRRRQILRKMWADGLVTDTWPNGNRHICGPERGYLSLPAQQRINDFERQRQSLGVIIGDKDEKTWW